MPVMQKAAQFYIEFYSQGRDEKVCYFHDAFPLAHLVQPDLFEFTQGNIRVSTDDLNRGQTIVSIGDRHTPYLAHWRRYSKPEKQGVERHLGSYSFVDRGSPGFGINNLAIFEAIKADHGLSRSISKIHYGMLDKDLIILIQAALTVDDNTLTAHETSQHFRRLGLIHSGIRLMPDKRIVVVQAIDEGIGVFLFNGSCPSFIKGHGIITPGQLEVMNSALHSIV